MGNQETGNAIVQTVCNDNRACARCLTDSYETFESMFVDAGDNVERRAAAIDALEYPDCRRDLDDETKQRYDRFFDDFQRQMFRRRVTPSMYRTRDVTRIINDFLPDSSQQHLPSFPDTRETHAHVNVTQLGAWLEHQRSVQGTENLDRIQFLRLISTPSMVLCVPAIPTAIHQKMDITDIERDTQAFRPGMRGIVNAVLLNPVRVFRCATDSPHPAEPEPGDR